MLQRLPAVYTLLASENPPEGRRRLRTRRGVEVPPTVTDEDLTGYLRACEITLTYDPRAKTLRPDTPRAVTTIIGRAS
jgi:hypothetical protein